MRVIDPGHCYALQVLDGEPGEEAIRRFVKRIGPKFPGNEEPPYPGTLMQEELRVIIDRARYVCEQTPCAETEAAIGLMEGALLLFEIRAKRVKGKTLDAATVADVVGGHPCITCGHVFCAEHASAAIGLEPADETSAARCLFRKAAPLC